MRRRANSVDSYLETGTHAGSEDADVTTFVVTVYLVDRQIELSFSVYGDKCVVSLRDVVYRLRVFSGPLGRALATTVGTWHTGGREIIETDTFESRRVHYITASATEWNA